MAVAFTVTVVRMEKDKNWEKEMVMCETEKEDNEKEMTRK